MAKLEVYSQESKVKWCYLPSNWSGDTPIPQANSWVHLLECLNPFSDDEALLLCQESEFQWVGWIPNHGEALLDVSQFCINP